MQVSYQSDERDNSPSDDKTSSEHDSEEEEEEDPYSDTQVDEKSEEDAYHLWRQQLGLRTRPKGRVNYNEEKIIPAETPLKVCRGLTPFEIARCLVHLQARLTQRTELS
jgi:hypothetical protein